MIQILGSGGLLGQAVVATAIKYAMPHNAVPYNGSDNKDICKWSPDPLASVVINCAGAIPQRTEIAAAMMHVNAEGPWHLAAVCNHYNLRLIHVSTDCVFQGPGPHAEDDLPDATSVYALSKRAGEITQTPHLTVRTSFVGERVCPAYLWPGYHLVERLKQGLPITASDNLLWSGHTVWTVANILMQLALRPEITGLLHIPGEFQSRAELVDRLQARLGTTAPVTRDDSFIADRRLMSKRWATDCPDLTPPPFDHQLETWGHI